MLKKSCVEFIEETASKAPVPGGGGVCAFVASLGVALGNMVGNLTLGKKKYADVQQDIERIIEEGNQLILKFNELVQKDADVFLPLSKAYGLPSETEAEKQRKEEVLQEALIGAVSVPYEIMENCTKAIDLLVELEQKGTLIAISDVGVGALLCKAALQGAKLNILINTAIMKNTNYRSRILKGVDEMIPRYISIADDIYEKVENRLKK